LFWIDFIGFFYQIDGFEP